MHSMTQPRGKRGHDLRAICHHVRKGRNPGSHWSKPVAPPLGQLLVILMLFVAGCATPRPKSLNLQVLPQIQEGITTRLQVEQFLGKPYKVYKEDSGVWLHYKEFAGKSRIQTEAIMIKLDDRNLVSKIVTWRSRRGDESTLEIGRNIYPAQLAQIQPKTTTQPQVETMLGTPQNVVSTSDRIELIYSFDTLSKNQTFAIIIGPDNTVMDVEERTFVSAHLLGDREKERLPQIQIGQTTGQEVVKLLGKPFSIGKGRLGTSLNYVLRTQRLYNGIQIELGLDDKVTKVIQYPIPL
jgi:outer membrane protein assembly factor BamE (lipoprotein component of BamABCDE complex)